MSNSSLNRASGNLLYHVPCSQNMALYLEFDCYRFISKKVMSDHYITEVMFIFEVSLDM